MKDAEMSKDKKNTYRTNHGIQNSSLLTLFWM